MTAPNDVTGLRGWWKADAIIGLSDGQTVGTWEDSGTLNNDAVQTTEAQKPTYQTNEVNGLPCVRFSSAASQVLDINTANMLAMTNAASGFSAFAYINLTTTGATNRDILSISDGSGASPARLKFGQRLTGSGVWGLTGRRLDSPEASQNLEGGATQSGWQIITVVSDWANSNADIWRGETSEATTTTWLTDGTVSATNAVATRIGASPAGTGEFWEGDIAELFVYDNVVSSGDRTGLWDYLQAKYEPVGPFAMLRPAVIAP